MDVKSFSLKGKVALVLGGAGDLGRAIAETFSIAGAQVIISSRKQENLDKVAAEITAKSKGKVVGIAGHLGKLETIKVLVDAIMKDFKRIDIVAQNPNFYLDTSGYGHDRVGVLEYAVKTIGPDRVLFGSDFSINDPGTVIARIKNAFLTEEQKQKIFSGNLLELLKEKGIN